MNRRFALLLHIVRLVLLLASLVVAGAIIVPAAYAAPNPGDELAQYVFPPELVLKYRQEIGLDDTQSKALKDIVQKAQARFLDLQWDMQSEAGKLAQLLGGRHVDEAAAVAQAERVMTMERDVKKAQLSLLIRIKNLLTDTQQDKLAALRGKNP